MQRGEKVRERGGGVFLSLSLSLSLSLQSKEEGGGKQGLSKAVPPIPSLHLLL